MGSIETLGGKPKRLDGGVGGRNKGPPEEGRRVCRKLGEKLRAVGGHNSSQTLLTKVRVARETCGHTVPKSRTAKTGEHSDWRRKVEKKTWGGGKK